MNATITNVKEGEGALNYLSNDAEFVKSLKETIENINNYKKRLARIKR